MGKAKGPDWPEDDALLAVIASNGSQAGAARYLNVSVTTLKDRVNRRGLRDKVTALLSEPKPADAGEQNYGLRQDGDTVTVTLPSASEPKLGDYESLLRDRGLNPKDWTVTSLKANKWNAMTSDKATGDNRIVEMHQWTVVLKPAAHRVLILPAVHVPRVKRTKVGPPASEKPETILIEGDHQFPYHDQALHEAGLYALEDLAKHHRLAEHVLLGDTGDYPTISKHPDHPAARATPNDCIQCSYDHVREKCEAAPNVRRRKLKGNHDWRIEQEQLLRSERQYGIRPAQRWEDDGPEIPALHYRRLLHLDELGIELVEDGRGWEHGEIELVPGQRGLVVRHGWLTGAKTAESSVRKRGRSIIVGHIHRREHVFIYDPSMGCERQGVVLGTMSQVRGGMTETGDKFPHFAVLDNWLQGLGIVTRWPDGDFSIEHARWDGQSLKWRDKSWR